MRNNPHKFGHDMADINTNMFFSHTTNTSFFVSFCKNLIFLFKTSLISLPN